MVFFGLSFSTYAQVKTVRFVKLADGSYQTQINGQPFYAKGVCGNAYDRIDQLPYYGCNSIRSYDWANDKDKVLADSAKKYGLTVSQGLWIPHQNQGSNGSEYSDPVYINNLVKNTLVKVREALNKDAIIFWNLGNEMDINIRNKNMWNVMGQIADSIKRIDNNRRPVVTTIAQTGLQTIQDILQRAPQIDMIAMNAYDGIDAVDSYYQTVDKPYMITEWGITMNQYTSFGSLVELNSTACTQAVIDRYNRNMLGKPRRCLGSYLFPYGYKVIETPTKFSFMIPLLQGQLQHIFSKMDGMAFNFNGAFPANRAPIMDSLRINGRRQSSSLIVAGGTPMHFVTKAHDPEGNPLKYYYKLCYEIDAVQDGGVDPYNVIESGVFDYADTTTMGTFCAPYGVDDYRLYVYVTDDAGHAAYDNFPFRVASLPTAIVEGDNTMSPMQDGYVDQANPNAATASTDLSNLVVAPVTVKDDEKYAQIQFENPKNISAYRTLGGTLKIYAKSAMKGQKIMVQAFTSGTWNERNLSWNRRETGTLSDTLFVGEVTTTGPAYLTLPINGYGKRTRGEYLRNLIDTIQYRKTPTINFLVRNIGGSKESVSFDSKEEGCGGHPPVFIWQTANMDAIPCSPAAVSVEATTPIVNPCANAIFTITADSRCKIAAIKLGDSTVATYTGSAQATHVEQVVIYKIPSGTPAGEFTLNFTVVDAQNDPVSATTTGTVVVTNKKCPGSGGSGGGSTITTPVVTPNPVTADAIIISNLGTGSSVSNITIHDVLGRDVYNMNNVKVSNGKATLNLPMQSGWYFATITSGGSAAKTAFIVNR